MKHTIWLPLLLGHLLAAPASAKVLHVRADAPGPAHDGTTWATACVTVTQGLSAAVSGDEVWVAKGTYTEHVTVPGGTALYGGFAGTETARAQRDLVGNASVIDGGSLGYDTVVCNAADVVVDGLTILNGGNGVNVTNGTATINACRIQGSSSWGVAISSISTVTVSNCLVRNTLKCGLDVWGGNANIINNTVLDSGNYGIHVFSGATAGLANNILAFGRTAGVGVTGSTITACSHNDCFGNPAGSWYGYTPPIDQGNLTLDPLFVDRAAGDFRLQTTSPLLDAGDDSVVPAGCTDVEGRPRIQGAHVDVGAYESEPASPPLTLGDVTRCLSITCGLYEGTGTDLARLNAEAGNPALDLGDALRLARKVAGIE